MDLKEKAKTLKVGVVPWQLWIKSPAYLRLTPEKKIKSLLVIVKRKEEEIEELKESILDFQGKIAIVRTKLGNREKRLGQIQDVVSKLHNLTYGGQWYEVESRCVEVADLVSELAGLLKK